MTSLIIGSGGPITEVLTQNISWSHPEYPLDAWNATGDAPPERSIFACTSNNATIVEFCCEENFLPTELLDRSGNVTTNGTGSDGWVNWCKVFYSDLSRIDVPSESQARDWGRCFDSVAEPARNTHGSSDNITVDSNVWLCQAANLNGINGTWGLPEPTSGASPKSRVSGLTVLGLLVAPLFLSMGTI